MTLRMPRSCDRGLYISLPAPRQVRLKGVLAAVVTAGEQNKRNCGEAFESVLNLTEEVRDSIIDCRGGTIPAHMATNTDEFIHTVLVDV